LVSQDKGWWGFDNETMFAFTVTDFYDLNMVPGVLNPVIGVNYTYLCCCCCKSGPITGTIQINGKSGFVAGEKIQFEGEISNQASVKIKGWSAEIRQIVEYSASRNGWFGSVTQTRTDSNTVAKYDGSEELEAGEDKHISCQRSLELHTSAPIVIGNIPLKSEWDNIATSPRMPLMPPPVAPLSPGELPSAKMMPSPSPPPPPASIRQQPPGFSSGINYATNYSPSPIAPPVPMQQTAPTVLAYPDMPSLTYNEWYGAGAPLKDDNDQIIYQASLSYLHVE